MLMYDQKIQVQTPYIRAQKRKKRKKNETYNTISNNIYQRSHRLCKTCNSTLANVCSFLQLFLAGQTEYMPDVNYHNKLLKIN